MPLRPRAVPFFNNPRGRDAGDAGPPEAQCATEETPIGFARTAVE
ncbi:hypothetical protein [Belnapia sp. F-4-1]|nr:hypothetical protein [Belnapia sp. F-4-1]